MATRMIVEASATRFSLSSPETQSLVRLAGDQQLGRTLFEAVMGDTMTLTMFLAAMIPHPTENHCQLGSL
jgi:hypothetical protein